VDYAEADGRDRLGRLEQRVEQRVVLDQPEPPGTDDRERTQQREAGANAVATVLPY
jgi:hypothetical protein